MRWAARVRNRAVLAGVLLLLLPAPVVRAAAGTATRPEAAAASGSDYPERPAAAQPVELQRDLGYLEPPQQQQLEQLIEVKKELSDLPVRCAVCRIAALERLGSAVALGLDPNSTITSTEDAEARLGATLRRLCPRVRALQLLGVMDRRMRALRAVCKELMAEPPRLARLATLSGELAMAVAKRNAGAAPAGSQQVPAIRASGPMVDEVCAGAGCSDSCGSSIAGWPAMLEVILGREPLSSALLTNVRIHRCRSPLPSPLLQSMELRGSGCKRTCSDSLTGS